MKCNLKVLYHALGHVLYSLISAERMLTLVSLIQTKQSQSKELRESGLTGLINPTGRELRLDRFHPESKAQLEIAFSKAKSLRQHGKALEFDLNLDRGPITMIGIKCHTRDVGWVVVSGPEFMISL